MFPKLSEKSFIKQKPDSHIYIVNKDNMRDAVTVNNSASDILKLCDGTHELSNIISILKEKYNEEIDIVKKNIEEFLDPLISSGVIEDKKVEIPSKIIRGDLNIYYPDVIIWEITDYCPLKCRHCYLPKKNNYVVSKDDIDRILNMIDDMGVYQVQITGGEALTHPYLEYIINQLIDRRIIVLLSTSGMIFNDGMFKYLIRLKEVAGSSIRVSLDGNKQTHNYIRRNEKAYDKAIEFIKKVCDAGIQCQIGTVIVNQKKQEIEELTVKVKDLGVSLIEIGTVILQGNAKENNLTPSLTVQELHAFLKELSDKYKSDSFVVKLPTDLIEKNCGSGHKVIRINPNMDISLCPMTEFTVGNLNIKSISEIMEQCGKVFHDVIAPCKELCKDCDNKHICKNCIAQGFNNKDKVTECYWFKSQGKFFQHVISI